MNIDTNIQKSLTPEEKELFSILRTIVSQKSHGTTLRVAGGWLRNKLLGKAATDIDIMVDNLSGEQMARLVTDYLGVDPAHTIKSNPEKSKNITTSKAYIPLPVSKKTLEVDFAQARSEIYKDNSRIPELKSATPQQDAYRRDFTVNSMFYNLATNQIEDFTGMGIKDLIAKNLRTPLDPLTTFKEDPLRIFRCIRFSSQLGFNIDPSTYEAIKDPSLREEIKKKVSKERIGSEFIKAINSSKPDYAIGLFKDTGLMDDIISEALKGTKYENKMASLDMEQGNIHHKLNLWGHTMEVVKNVLNKYPDTDSEKRVTMVLAALMHDLGKLFKDIQGESKSHPGNKSYHGHEDESKQIAEYILKYLKIEPYIQQVAGLSEQHMRAHQFTEQGQGGARALRKFLRVMGEQSLNWLDVFNLSVADAYSKGLEIEPETVKQYQELEQRLQEALTSMSPTKDIATIKPILDGNAIMNILNVKPGPIMKEITNFVKELMDENPNITKEEAANELKKKYQNPQPPVVTSADSKGAKDSKASTCSAQIIQQKTANIRELFNANKTREAVSVMNGLRESFGNDEKITRLIAINTFKSLIKDSGTRDNNLVQYVFDKATENFFDSVLNAYALGILLITKTATNDNVLREVASRVLKMSPGILRSVVDALPKEQIVNQDLANFVKEQLNQPKQP